MTCLTSVALRHKVSKTAPPSFVATLLEQEDSINHDPANWETTVKWAAASLYGGKRQQRFIHGYKLYAIFFRVASTESVSS